MTAPTGRKVGRPRKDATRIDGPYSNIFLGLGNNRDRSSFTKHATSRLLSYQELEDLYCSDGFARRIVDIPADDMLRNGYEVEGVSDDEAIMAYLENINVNAKLSDALKWSSLYGGALMVMLVNDGGLLEDPLNENSIRELEELRVYDRWAVSRHEKYNDPSDKRFGKTKTYMVSPVTGMPYIVHESRCIVIDGIGVPDRVRERNDGWGNSKLQHCYDQLVRVGMSHVWANALLERSQQAVHGINGLTNILRAPGGENLVRQRVDMVDMSRSVSNTVVIDGEESYEIKSTSFAGVQDIMDRLSQSLCAVTGMPETLLFGRQQKGLGNSGQGDLENWYSNISQMQEVILLPVIDRIVTIALKATGKYTDDYLIKFCPLWMTSDKELAEIGERKAKTAEIYVNMGALDPSEVRKSIEDDYDIDDVELMPEMPDDDVEDDPVVV